MSAAGDTRAVLTIDLGALARNWRRLRDRVAPAECSAVVKADAYGIGIAHAVPALADAGCRTFFVAQLDEALAVRAALATREARVLVLNGLGGMEPVPEFAEHRLIPVLGSPADIRSWMQFAGQQAGPATAALHFNTGMNRLGLADVAEALELSRWRLELVMSHFVAAEERGNPLNGAQIAAFEAIAAHFPHVPRSLANSSGIFLPSRPLYDLVRPGYALYGGSPVPGQPNPMEAVVRLEAPVLQVHMVEAGASVGYNGMWVAQRRSRVATLGVGYADGFPFHGGHGSGQTGKAVATVNSSTCPVVGRISMDLIVLDVTDAGLVQPGEMAQLLGPDISIDDLARCAGTIGYTVLTGLGRRYRRVLVNSP